MGTNFKQYEESFEKVLSRKDSFDVQKVLTSSNL